MNREELIELIRKNTMETAEVLEYLGISKQRLSDMNRTGKLVPIKKGVYLKSDIEARANEQDELREKYYRPTK